MIALNLVSHPMVLGLCEDKVLTNHSTILGRELQLPTFLHDRQHPEHDADV